MDSSPIRHSIAQRRQRSGSRPGPAEFAPAGRFLAGKPCQRSALETHVRMDATIGGVNDVSEEDLRATMAAVPEHQRCHGLPTQIHGETTLES